MLTSARRRGTLQTVIGFTKTRWLYTFTRCRVANSERVSVSVLLSKLFSVN